MGNKKTLTLAKSQKNDEFYTQIDDIQNEMNSYFEYNQDVFRDKIILLPCDDPTWSNFTLFFINNFKKFGIKKIISTSYFPKHKAKQQLSLFNNCAINEIKPNGKISVIDRNTITNDFFELKNIQWEYLQGDGDFNSDEVRKFRDEADIIITNPPFSQFRKFISWVMEANKQFAIIGHQNAITYKEVFPLIKENKIWLGNGFKGNCTYFISDYFDYATAGNHIEGMIRVSGVTWFTNINAKDVIKH